MEQLLKAKYADQILTHYIRLLLERSGIVVNYDILTELDGLIENAINEAAQAAVDEAVSQAMRGIPSSVLE